MIVGREKVGDVLLSMWKIPEDLGRCAALSLDDSPRPGVRARSKLLSSAPLSAFSISLQTLLLIKSWLQRLSRLELL
jgi:HD-like signal output (HDOD) protein